PAWKKEFSDRFVNGEYHAIFTGRAGYEYENEKNEETGKREVFKSGIKMKVEGETAYEPDMLVLMERFEEVLGDDKKVWREATIIKDRSTLLDGKTFKNPSYASFEPAIEALLDNPVPRDAFVAPEGDTTLLFRNEENVMQFRRDRDKAMEELDGFLTRLAPGSTGKDKQLKLELLEIAFGTTSETAIGEMTPARIRDGRKAIIEEAIARSLVHKVETGGETKIRFGSAPAALSPKEEAKVEEAARDIEATEAAEVGRKGGKRTAKVAA
ncbi:MAG: hypothetical protein J0H89_12175, partial [Rhizobiales bacterium]|nr:hypothetical protein [Hyphomicrobiales bacterium]